MTLGVLILVGLFLGVASVYMSIIYIIRKRKGKE